MQNLKIHTPDGVNDILEYETALKRTTTDKIAAGFKSFGYFEVEPPSFEFAEVFAGAKTESMIKFFDSAGRTLALRHDLTTPVARICATKMAKKRPPHRLFYIGSAYRNTSPYKGALQREFTQAGIEFIGSGSPAADAEVIALAIRTFLDIGLTDFQIELGQIEYFNGIMDCAGLPADIAAQIRRLMDRKSMVALSELVSKHLTDEKIKEIILNLPHQFGDISILEDIACPDSRSRAAIDNLREIYKILTEYGVEKYVSIDLSLVSGIDYYTGVIIKGFARGMGFPICGGGRYDNLVGEFGDPLPATGVAIGLDRVLAALGTPKIKTCADTIVSYSASDRKLAIDITAALRQTDIIVQLWPNADDLINAKEFAKEYEIGGIIHIDKGEIALLNMQNGSITPVTLEELV